MYGKSEKWIELGQKNLGIMVKGIEREKELGKKMYADDEISGETSKVEEQWKKGRGNK
jgi:hypothetical protein